MLVVMVMKNIHVAGFYFQKVDDIEKIVLLIIMHKISIYGKAPQGTAAPWAGVVHP